MRTLARWSKNREPAAPVATQAGAAAAGHAATSVAEHRVRLYELVTKEGGFFCTAGETEQAAIGHHGWSTTQTPLYYLSAAPFPGGKPLFRLRRPKKQSSIVTASVAERERLVASGDFRYDGILGYAPGSAGAGGDVKVFRLSNNNNIILITSVNRFHPSSARDGFRRRVSAGAGAGARGEVAPLLWLAGPVSRADHRQGGTA
ncbi:hypothetical protein MF672_030805 [Actinomadura sp. ATCC 31491]|uniref:DUF5648 domain-containing protein n=1 Tax=Actinomadura luzonensis TaxID=2805427 RepID=A0ABT0G0L5_9ACTN|nr:hypothetical protein [Actinomadura luzonensis]MCK2218147.1 hypothetical protein [Actinomadura luzonensis]